MNKHCRLLAAPVTQTLWCSLAPPALITSSELPVSPMRSTKPPMIALSFALVPSKSLNFKDELPALSTSILDAMTPLYFKGYKRTGQRGTSE